MGAIHYKDNYADKSEPWKDIDLTWEGNRITKAPYELTFEGNKITIKDKKSGEVSTIELLKNKPAGLSWKIIPEFTRVRFQHTLPSNRVPFEARFKVTGKIPFLTRAFDDEGELLLEATLKDGILTEKLSDVKDKLTGLVRPAKGNIRIDPTWQVTASTDDTKRRLSDDYWSLTANDYFVGGHSTVEQGGSGMRFQNITIPGGSAITPTTKLTFQAMVDRSGTVCRTRISAEDIDDPDTFVDDKAVFDTRWAARTAERVDWEVGAWVEDTDYDSPDITPVIDAVINLPYRQCGWTQVAPQLPPNRCCHSLCEYNGKLYGGTLLGELLEWNGVDAWVKVGNVTVGHGISSLCEYSGKLYAGSSHDPDGGELWEWNDVDTLAKVAGQLNSQIIIKCMAVYNGKLYGGTIDGGRLFEWNDVDAWVEKAGQLNAQDRIFIFCILSGELYAGTGFTSRLFKWNGVNAWTQVASQAGTEPEIRGLLVFGGHIFGSTTGTGQLYVWNGADAWALVANQLNSQTVAYQILEFGGSIYASTYGDPNGARLFKSSPVVANWQSGNDIVIFWEDFEDRSDHNFDAYRQGKSWDGDPSNCAILTVTYTPPPNTPEIISANMATKMIAARAI